MTETFTKDGATRTFARFALPAVLTSLLMISAYLVDGVLIGHFIGSGGLASFNLVFPMYGFLAAAGIVISTGGSALIGRHLGQDNPEKAEQIFNVSLVLATVISAVISVITLLLADDITRFLGASDLLFDATREYLTVLAVFFAPFIVGICFHYFIRNEGDATYPIKVTAVSVAVNIPVTYVFLGVFGMGLGAAALGSGISLVVGVVLLVRYFFGKRSVMSYKKPVFDLHSVKKILYNGSSEGISDISVGVIVLFFNLTLIRHLGEIGIAAFAIISLISLVLIMVNVGLSMALQPMVSYNLGANMTDRVRETLRASIKIAVVVGTVFYGAVFAFGHHFIGLFSAGDEDLAFITFDAIRIFGLMYLFIGINYLASGYLTALQRPKMSLVISLSHNLVFVAIGLLALPHFFGVQGIWWAVPLANIATVFISIYCIRRINCSMAKPATGRDDTGQP